MASRGDFVEFRVDPQDHYCYKLAVTREIQTTSATEILIHVPVNRENDGPAMSALTDLQRNFVAAMMMMGPSLSRARGAAAAAGFTHPEQAAYQMMRNSRVLAALKEEAGKRLVGAALVGVDVMTKIANDDAHKDQFKAAKYLAEINGFTVEQKIVIEHVSRDQREMILEIVENARIAGIDPRPLLLQAGITDAEFTVVTPEEDWTKT